MATALPVPMSRAGRRHRRELVAALPLIAPWVVGFLAFELGPLLGSAGISFLHWDLIQKPLWAGAANYRELLGDDPLFWQALKVTVIYSGLSVPIRLAAALLVAILMNQKIPAIALFRTIYYMPSVVSGVAVALLWYWVFNAKFGVLNYLLSFFGIAGPNWLMDTRWVMPAFIVMSLWGIGGAMIIFLAGLQGVPQELYDAAQVDGAGRLMSFRHVTWPMLTPVVFFNLVMGVIGSFQTFTASYVMTLGGPANATLFYVLYLYRNAFQYFKMGKACALAWILFLIVLALTALVIRSSSLWVFYEAELKGRK